MNLTTTAIPGVLVIEPRVFEDSRGHFFESFNHAAFERAIGGPAAFVQDNQSSSRAGVLRGLHYQTDRPQGKLVRVVRGAIYDVATGDLVFLTPNGFSPVGLVAAAQAID